MKKLTIEIDLDNEVYMSNFPKIEEALQYFLNSCKTFKIPLMPIVDINGNELGRYFVKEDEMQIKYSYRSPKGIVYGNCWGGGQVGFATRKTGWYDTREELSQDLQKMFDDGSIDSGMGFESLVGAVCVIECRAECEVDGEVFVKEDSEELEFIGEIPGWAEDRYEDDLFYV